VEKKRVHEGVTASGAVAYTTARWAADSQAQEQRGTVTVFLDPPKEASELWMRREARRLADDMFRRLHPDADEISEAD
jgi:hypothetical protein